MKEKQALEHKKQISDALIKELTEKYVEISEEILKLKEEKEQAISERKSLRQEFKEKSHECKDLIADNKSKAQHIIRLI